MKRASATSRYVPPAATSSATRRSVGVSESAASARPLRPEPRAELLEGAERSLQRVARRPLLPAPAADRPHDQVRPRQLERLAEALVQLEGALELGESTRQVAARGREEPAAPGCGD